MKNFLVVVAAACCLLAPAQKGATQTLFTWPDSKVNLTGYRYLDNCVVAGARIWDSIGSVQAIVFDTMFSPRGQIGTPTPVKVQTSLRECLSNYTPTKISREYTLIAQRTYLYAGQLAEAAAVVHHGLTQIAPTDTASRAALIDSAIQQYTSVPPFQFPVVQSYIDTLERYGAAWRSWNLLRDYYWLMHAAYVAGEDPIATSAARRVFELAPVAVNGASGPEIAAVGIAVGLALRITKGEELLDSLRKGTAAYAALYAENFRQMMGFVPIEQPRDVEAPVLQGDYWFPKTAANQEYPRKGRVSIVVFVDDHVGGGPVVMGALSQLRRLTQKYPTVDFVLATSTMGWFGPLEPPTSDREAALADSVFRNFHRLNPVLSVTKGIFIQLDAPDNRRVYQPYPNIEAYPPSNGVNKKWRTFIIDDHQRIVDVLALNSREEGWTMRLLDTVLERVAGGQK